MKSIPENRMGVVCMPVKLSLIILLSIFFQSNSLYAQFLNPGNGVIMYDNAEKLPQTGWGMDFTKGYAMVTGGSQSTSSPDSRANITLSTDYARKGTRSYKMHVEKRTDYPGCCQWVRSEVMWMAPSQQTTQNEYRWAAVSILIAPSFQFENRPTQIGFDTKASPDDLQTPFWLGIMNGQYYVDGYFIGGTKYLGPVIKGVWEDWLLERNWKSDASGFLRFYRNGKLVFEKYGANYFGRSGDAPIARMQHGLYKWVWATSNGQGWGEGSPVAAANAPMDIYLDEIRFGSPSAKLADFLLDQAPPANQAPTASAGNNQTITLPINTVTLQGTGNDPDGSIASYQWTKVSGPNGGAITTPNAAGTVITGLLQGVYTYRLTVTDNGGATATRDVQITVNAAANLAPVANAGLDQSVTLPINTVTLTGSGTDADGTIASYGWTKVSGPAGGNIQSSSSASTAVTGLIQGVYVFRLTVTDNAGATATNNIQITVNAAPVANTPPTSISGADQTITLPVNTATLNGSGTDADGTIASYAWTKLSGPAGGNISSANTAATDITSLQEGVYVFRLTVTDNDGATATNDVQITVNAAPVANTPPTSISGADQTITLPVNTATLNGSGTDADGTIASYAWTKVSGPAGGNISSPNTAATDITNLQEGVYVFRLTVTDNDGATATNDVQITVNAAPVANTPPTSISGADQTITLPVNTATLNGSGTDADGTIASYAWTKVSGPAGGNISSSNTAATDITNLQEGVYVFRLTVTDNDGATATNDVQITVNAAPVANTPPTSISGADQTITLPVNTATLNGSGTDADGTIASYAWTKVSGPAGGNISSANTAASDITSLQEGVYVFRLTVTDNDGATATNDVQITVNAATVTNTPPTAVAGADQTITLPDNTATLNGSGTDADGTIASYAWTKVSGPAGGNISSPNTAATDITNLQEGVYVFRLTVTDNDGATATNDVQITVNAATVANTAPAAAAGADQTITLPDNTATLNGSGTDADGTIASYAWTKLSGPAGGNISSANTAATDITNLQEGVYVFRLTVTDNDGATATNDVQITVNAAPVANTPPTSVSGADQTITLPDNTATLNGSGTDADGTIASYAWTKVSGPAGGNISSANTAATDITNLQEGVYVFRLTVTDNDGATATNDVQITVNAAPVANTPPTSISGADQTITLPVNTATLNGSGTDADGTIASYAWTKVSGPAGGNISSANTAATDITNLQEGVYVFRLTVTDNDGATATNDVQITVNAATVANTAPAAAAGADQTITLPDNTATLNGSGTDADGTIASYAWTKVSGPAGGNISSANTAATDITNLQEGVYVFRLTVTDNDGATATNDVQITVNAATVANTAPAAAAGADQTITLPDNTATLNGSGTDADGTIASYTWTKVSGPAGGNISSPNTAATDITNLQAGVYIFRLTVTDNDGATASNNVQITVNAAPVANTAPTAAAGANQTITLPTSSVGLSGNGSDADGTIASYSWTQVSGPSDGTIQSPSAVSTQVTGLVAGTYVFRLTVTDDDGATGSDNVQVVVNASAPAPNAAPLADPGADKTITLPTSSVTLAGRGTDSDGSIVDYTWTKVSGPAGGAIQNNDAASTPVTGLIAGTYTYRLTVTDNDGATGSADVRVIVNAAPPPSPNDAPVANAGANQVITLPASSVNVSGTATDSDGTIAGYEWTKVSGPNGGNIASAGNANTQISGLTAGTYVFRLTVTDNDGDTDSDDMLVVVNAAAANLPPTAAAGSNITIRLPANAVTLNGSGADADGQVVSYRWSKVSGPNPGGFQSATSQSTGMTNLRQGTYVVRLTVTDNDGATATDDITILVNAAPATPEPPANVAPTANAGANRSITLPVDVVTLNGVGTDVDGTIASFRWSKVSGPTAGSLANTTAQSTGVTGLVAGTYVFRLTVTDNDGAQGNDDVQVTVNAAAVAPVNVAPVVTAGNSRTITLPISTVNLNGTAVDPDGSVVSYRWLKVSGPGTGVIQAATSPATSVVSLTEGEYVYRLTVTDNKGAQGSDELKVTVRAAAPLPNQLPVANAGADISVTLPANTAILNGSRSADPDGTISSYKWVMVSGPVSGEITNAEAATATLSDLVKGDYVFELTVTDNDGASATDRVIVKVVKNNKLPVVQTRDTITVLLPAQNTELDALQSYDPDGSIRSFKWEKKSGPGSPRILTPGAGKTIITDLLQGTYNYEVTVTDDDDDAVKGLVTVIVKNSTSRRLIPVVNLYPNPAETNITLTFDAEVDGRSDVTFYDLLGRVVLKDTFIKNSRTFTRKINITSLPAGVYAVEIAIAEAEKVVRKVVKQ